MNNTAIAEKPMTSKKRVLHVGCGSQKLIPFFKQDEWQEVRLDIDANVKPDIIASMTDMSVVESNQFDAIWSSHNVEHLYPHDVPTALKEFHRVLKEGGFFYVTLPDIQAVAEAVAKGQLEDPPLYISVSGPISAIDILYGFRAAMSRGNLFMAHRTGFTARTLAKHLASVGFSNIKVQRKGWDLWAMAYKNSKVDKAKDKVNIVEDDINEAMQKRDTLFKEPAINIDNINI